MSATVESYAYRFFFPRPAAGNRGPRGIESYFAFRRAERPAWWSSSEAARLADVHGVFEQVAGSPKDAILVRESGLTVLDESGRPAQHVDYAYVDRIGLSSKDEPPGELVIHGADGSTRRIPTYYPSRLDLALHSFLLYAPAAAARSSKAAGA